MSRSMLWNVLRASSPIFYLYLPVAPPNDMNLVMRGAIERIFQSPRCQIHHYPPRCGEAVLREKRSPNRKKENPFKRSLQVLSLYLRVSKNAVFGPNFLP